VTNSDSFASADGANPPASVAESTSVNSQNDVSTGPDGRVNLPRQSVNLNTGESGHGALPMDRDAVRNYLTEVYAGVPGLLQIWTTPAKGSGAFFSTDEDGIGQAVTYVEAQWRAAGQQGIYARITTLTAKPTDPRSRGSVADSKSFIGLWTDLDFGTVGHKGGKLPPGPAEAQEIYSTSGLPEASIIVNSGGGLYHLVLLDEPVDLTDTQVRMRVGQLARRWQQRVKISAEKLGYNYGTGVSDLARVLRIPGTVNAKEWTAQRLAVHRSTGLRYSLEELEAACPEPPKPKRTATAVTGQAGDARARMQQLLDELRATTFERNNALNRLAYMAYQYAGAGQLDPNEVEAEFTKAGLDTGLDVAEVRHTVASARKGLDTPYPWTVRMNAVQAQEQYDMWVNQVDAHGQYIGDQPQTPAPQADPHPGDVDLNHPDQTDDDNAPGTYSAPDAPMRVARELEPMWIKGGSRTLHHWRDTWMRWTGTHWTEVGNSALKSRLYLKLEHAIFYAPNKKGEMEPRPWNPSIKKVAALTEAIAAVTHLDEKIEPGQWLGHKKDGPRLVSCANTMIDPITKETRPHTPAYFTTSAVPYDYDPAAECPQWLDFLDKVFPGDKQSQQLLQEWMGYVVSGWTHYQKGIQLIGPPRAGKGTIVRIIEKLIGNENTVGTTLKTLVTNFGLQPLIGKSLCTVGDAHMENRNSSEIVARLLSITGEDSLPVDRKNKIPWNGKLPVRMMILANKAPRFNDSSGAILGRFLTLHFTQSFAGREDKTLESRLTTELSGILNWALEGLRRLDERTYFVQPDSAESIIETQREQGAPHQAFIEDRCATGEDEWILKEQLYYQWNNWCQPHGIKFPGSSASFAAELYAAVPGIRQGRKRINGKLERVFYGITCTVEPGMVCPPTQSDPRRE
jgi:putative DNA primase/helicase